MTRRRLLTLGTIVGALLVCSPTASATTRHASPTGSGAPPCLQSSPCPLVTAASTGVAVAGDNVSLAPGTYTNAGGITVTNPNVEIAGAPGGAKPVLRFTGASGLSFTGTGAKLRDVVVEAPAALQAVGMVGNSTVSDIEVTTGGVCVGLMGSGSTIQDSKLTTSAAIPGPFGGCISAFPPSDNTTVRNVEATSTSAAPVGFPSPLVAVIGSNLSVDRLVATNPVGPAVQFASFGPGAQPSVMRRSRITGASSAPPPPGFPAFGALTVFGDVLVSDSVVRGAGPAVTAISIGGGKLRNVTGVATGTGSRGLHATSFFGVPATATSARNSILRGDDKDVVVDPAVPAAPGCIPVPFPCGSPGGNLTITHSNFRTATGALAVGSGDNQSADPLFADAAAGNFRPLAGSPAIDAGTDDADNGPNDLDGRNRKIGSAVDIGAYEFQPVVAAPQAPAETGSPVITPPPPDRVRPALRGLGMTNRTFRVGAGPTAVSTAAAKRGTTFVYTLSESARVTITVQRQTSGRRKGRGCVKPTRKLRKAKKCARFVRAGELARGGMPGANAVPFTGRIGTAALRPGNYRAVFAASDAAGNKATKKPSIGFRVVKR